MKITADVTAFEADMTTPWMQVEMVVNAQNNDDNGANNNIGWQQLGGQDVLRDGQPHTYTWELPEALTAKIAGADDTIALVRTGAGVEPRRRLGDQVLHRQHPGRRCRADPSVVVSSFEGGLDGWYDDTYTAGTIAVGATGATAGTQALQVEGPGGWQQLTKVNVKPHLAMLANSRA